MPVLRISLHAALEQTTVVQIHHFTTGSSSGGNTIIKGREEPKLLLEHKESNHSKQVR